MATCTLAMNKRIFLLLAVALTPLSMCWAQGNIFTELKSDLKRADRLYEQLAYAPAAELYRKGLGKAKMNQDDIKIKLARCYYRLHDPQQSVYWYEQVIAKDSLFTEQDRIQYAQSLSGDQQYEKSKEQYQAMSSAAIAQEKLQGLNALDKFFEDSAYYRVARLDVSTDAAEFGPAYFKDGLIFSSSKANRSPMQQIFRWNQTPFLDLYFAPLDSTGQLQKPKKLRGKVNTRFHEGPVVLLDSGQRMVFTRNNFYEGKRNLTSDRVNNLKLYQAEQSHGGTWTNVLPLPFNNDEYSTGHPAVSPDGKTLYFVSDAPGGEGGTDLYTSELNDGQWSTPRNMGPAINTAGDEMFPFLDHQGVLYFASAGHAGLGGLDIFKVRPDGKPENMGYPINTHRDDFGLIVNELGDTGYFASNRLHGGADDDLYVASISRPAILLVQGQAVDQETREGLGQAVVTLRDAQGESIGQAIADEDGFYQFEVPLEEQYSVVVSQKDYQPSEQSIDTRNVTTPTLEVENMLLRNLLVVEGRVYDKKTGAPVDSATVALINKATGKTEKEVMVNHQGTYGFKLQSDQRYEIRAYRQKYLGAVDSVKTEGIDHKTFMVDLLLDNVILNQPVSLDNIYYDFDKWNIRPSAALELDKLVEFMNDNATYQVELGSHTDSRGNNAYNEHLSQKRSESAVYYIISKGVDRNRIVAKGYGETRLVNDCADDVPCSAAQHQENRRTEFTVVKD